MNLAFFGTPAFGPDDSFADEKFIPYLKGMVGGATLFPTTKSFSTLFEVIDACKKKEVTGVLSTNKLLLSKLLGKDAKEKLSLDDYAGSYFNRDGIEFVFLNPLSHIVQVPYGKFLTARYISKLTKPAEWGTVPEFSWQLGTASNLDAIFELFKKALLVSFDIETVKDPIRIKCVGFTAIFAEACGSLSSNSVVIPLDSEFALAWIRRFCWELKAIKVAQGGKYDVSYLSRYDSVPYNYLLDTMTMMHCTYSEMPKDLGFINNFWVREAFFWKDLSETNDLMEYYKYNALDTWGTACVAIRWLLTAPDYAKRNYEMEFPLTFPAHLCEMTGIKRDMPALQEANKTISARIVEKSKQLEVMTATPGFNSNSHVHVKALMKCMGLSEKDRSSSDEKHLNKAAYLHPLNARLVSQILDIRGDRKLVSTYLPVGEDAKEFNGRILFALNPHGTDTGRLASREHHFWCGLQIQNIPRGIDVKRTLIADEDFVFGECDLEQAESRDTAYAAGDESLIYAVEADHDFHSYNASKFFGKSYDEIYDAIKKKAKDKPLRDLSKRVNHGANYCMGEQVLVDTMGLENICRAQALLRLPKHWGPIDIAHHLLTQFHKTYPTLARIYYPWIWNAIITTNLLVGATGWTRYCFGDVVKNKRNKNAYVAHVAQSLNAMVLNKAFMRVFYEIAMHPIHGNNFKLIAQIHDSIFFQFRKGHNYLCAMVKEMMEIPVTITGADGKTRTFVVPAAVKAGADGLGVLRWSDTE